MGREFLLSYDETDRQAGTIPVDARGVLDPTGFSGNAGSNCVIVDVTRTSHSYVDGFQSSIPAAEIIDLLTSGSLVVIRYTVTQYDGQAIYDKFLNGSHYYYLYPVKFVTNDRVDFIAYVPGMLLVDGNHYESAGLYQLKLTIDGGDNYFAFDAYRLISDESNDRIE